jgi:hypothetical protein
MEFEWETRKYLVTGGDAAAAYGNSGAGVCYHDTNII